MTAAVPTPVKTATPQPTPPRSVRLIRVGVLVVAGLVIAFTANQHESLPFDLIVVSATLGLLAIAHAIEWFARRSTPGSPTALLLALTAAGAAFTVVSLPQGPVPFAVTVAVWALVSALLEFIGAAVVPGSRSDAVIVGTTGILLSILTLLVRGDTVAVIGFFGAYAVIVGVFLGISAFDTRRTPKPRG